MCVYPHLPPPHVLFTVYISEIYIISEQEHVCESVCVCLCVCYNCLCLSHRACCMPLNTTRTTLNHAACDAHHPCYPVPCCTWCTSPLLPCTSPLQCYHHHTTHRITTNLAYQYALDHPAWCAISNICFTNQVLQTLGVVLYPWYRSDSSLWAVSWLLFCFCSQLFIDMVSNIYIYMYIIWIPYCI